MGPATSSASDFGSRMRHVREQRNDVSRLPGGIFSRAFVRSYAAEIGADPEETVRDFLCQFPHESVTGAGSSVLPDGQSRGRQLVARAMVIAATVAVVVMVILFLSLK
jgi:cytoskeletal protein RodZ